MKANLHTTMSLYAEAAGSQTGGSSLINYPGSPADKANEPGVRDKVRKRLVPPFASPDVDAQSTQHTNETRQKDNAGFVGKKYIVQDVPTYGYGHFISEHESSSSAALAQEARPGARILKHPVLHNQQLVRNNKQKQVAKSNPDVL